MVIHAKKDENSILCELIGYLHELVKSNLDNFRFNKDDITILSILLNRHCNNNDEQVLNRIKQCEKENKKLLKESSSELIKRVYKSLHNAVSQSVTIVKGKNITINKNYPE